MKIEETFRIVPLVKGVLMIKCHYCGSPDGRWTVVIKAKYLQLCRDCWLANVGSGRTYTRYVQKSKIQTEELGAED